MVVPEFTLKVHQQRHLSTSDTVMDAVLRITAGDLAGDGVERGPAAEVILLDCSGSMSMPPTKIAAARRAAVAAIDTLPDGTHFAVVQGTNVATMCYPDTKRMAVAGERARAEARVRVNGMGASGGTAMGTWLALAGDLFATTSAVNRHALLLTDGENHEPVKQLDAVLAACADGFTCDARGIGENWNPHDLHRIVDALHGDCDAIRTDDQLTEDFTALAKAAMAKAVPDLRLRVTTTPGTSLRGFKQAYPREVDHTRTPARHEGPVWEFTTGAWGAGDLRDFQLVLSLAHDDRDPVGEDLGIAFVELFVPDAEPLAYASVLVQWTHDPLLAGEVDPSVAHYKGQAALTRAMFAGFDAFRAHRLEDAAREWGTAMRLATESSNEEALTRLGRLVDVVDAAEGIVRLKPGLSTTDALSVGSGANRSSRSDDRPDQRAQPVDEDDDDLIIAPCGDEVPSSAQFCDECGKAVKPA